MKKLLFINVDDQYKFVKNRVCVDYRELDGFQNGGRRLNLSVPQDQAKAIDKFLSFLPKEFIHTNLIPDTNEKGHLLYYSDWNSLNFNELMVFLGIIYSMQIIQLPEQKLYRSVLTMENTWRGKI